jgi:hypothetical protein
VTIDAVVVGAALTAVRGVAGLVAASDDERRRT